MDMLYSTNNSRDCRKGSKFSYQLEVSVKALFMYHGKNNSHMTLTHIILIEYYIVDTTVESDVNLECTYNIFFHHTWSDKSRCI